MNRYFYLVIMAGLLPTWCGCASIVSKSVYPVAIRSNPSSAEVTIVNRAGKEVYHGTTPATVQLKAGAGYFKGEDYTVIFEKPGYENSEGKIKRGLDGWYVLGNVFAGSLVGWLIVDPATGAMWTLKDLETTLSPQLAGKAGEQGLKIATLDEVPPELRSEMVKLDSDKGT